MKHLIGLVFIGIGLVVFTLLISLPSAGSVQADQHAMSTPEATEVQGTQSLGGEAEAALAAIEAAMQQRSEIAPAYGIFNTQIQDLRLNAAEDWAVGYMVLVDPGTNETLPSEPGLALVRKVKDSWQATLPGDAAWTEVLAAVPSEILPEADRDYWLEISQAAQAEAVSATYTGYYLPWKYNTNLSLSRSVAHVADYTTARNAYDFYHPTADLFPLYAAKPGTVWMFKDDVPTCWLLHCEGQGTGNYLVIKDTSTAPVSYMLYMHFAQGSIPPELKQVGAYVGQGQYIGEADNTGASWGHHVHFQVHQNPASYWGTSVDIIFNEVTINGGRPRSTLDAPYCNSTDFCNTFQTVYTSKNPMDWMPPMGSLTSPAAFAVVQTAAVELVGNGSDVGSGLKNAQFTAFYNNTWNSVGPLFTSGSFNYTFDLCAYGIPDGPLAVGLRLTDGAGNTNSLADVRLVQKDYACPANLPGTPDANQAVLYGTALWQGVSQAFPQGSYSGAGLGGLGDDSAGALKVGGNVQVTLFSEPNKLGRGATFTADDANLVDNLVEADRTSSLAVTARSVPPQVPIPAWPIASTAIAQSESLTLYWRNAGEATEFQAQLTGPISLASPWQPATYWSLGGFSLPVGTYTWQVQARGSGGTSAWSPPQTFIIGNPTPLVGSLKSLPYVDEDMLAADWTASGLWNRIGGSSAHLNQWWWGEGTSFDPYYYNAKSGSLTSPPIAIPAGGANVRFTYFYQTETSGRHWDRRWLQISVNGGPFTNLYQLSEDPMRFWMQSPPVNLPASANGQQVRLRFYFDTVDPSGASPDNHYAGWYIDDVTVAAGAVPAPCSDPEEEAVLTYNGASVNGTICGPGDSDLFSFNAAAGDLVSIDVDAVTTGSTLDTYLLVLGTDGVSVLAENDDQRPGFIDSLVQFKVPADGTYKLKVRAWDHGSSGDPTDTYSIRLYSGDTTRPSVTLTVPQSGGMLAGIPLALTATILEDGSGLEKVEFYWHSNDWLNDGWEVLPPPSQVGNEWFVVFDPDDFAEQRGATIFAAAYDNSGNLASDVAWNVTLDKTNPASALAALPANQDSPRIVLSWTASDATSGIADFDLQRYVGGAWVDEQLGLAPGLRALEYIGTPSTQYAFRMRAQDVAGNQEAYPASAEASTWVPPASELCATLDSYENDNDKNAASSLPVGGAAQIHNFCKASDYTNDEDWTSLTLTAGTEYTILIKALHPDTALNAILYAADGVTPVLQASAVAYGQSLIMRYIPQASGTYYLRVAHADGRLFGSAVQYSVWAFESTTTFFPAVYR